jgi:hypothetical protein
MSYPRAAASYCIFAALAVTILIGCQGFGTGNPTSPGSTSNIPPQSSYRIVGTVGTPFRALISDTRSSWQLAGTIPTSIVIVNDSPPDRIVASKVTNDSRLLSLELIQGFTIITLDSTVSNFGSVVGGAGGKLPSFAPPASPDVRFYVKTPLVGLFTALIEDETMGSAIESRIPAIILFDSPSAGRVDGIFSQPNFTGALDADLVVNGVLVNSNAGDFTVVVKGDD